MSSVGESITVLLVDDHTLFREGVAEIFAAEDSLRVVGEADHGEQAVSLVQSERPDVVLLDVEMPGMAADEALRRILATSPDSKVVVLTMHDEPRLVEDLLSAGAHGYVVKSATREELLSIVRTVHRDEERVVLSLSRDTLDRLRGQKESVLSSRESEVLSLTARAMSNAQIASHLYISEGTVKRHLTNIYAKLGVTSRLDAVNKAVRDGLIEPGEPFASWQAHRDRRSF